MVRSVTLPCETGSQKSKIAAEKKYVVSRTSAYIHDSNKIPTAKPCFRTRATQKTSINCPTPAYVGNQRWRPLTGSRNDITYISASIHDSNEISTAMPVFSGSNKTDRLVGILSHVRICRKSKMVAINRK